MNINEKETPSPWMTRKQAAEYLGVGLSTLAKLDRAGLGPVAHRPFPLRVVRYRAQDLDRWAMTSRHANQRRSNPLKKPPAIEGFFEISFASNGPGKPTRDQPEENVWRTLALFEFLAIFGHGRKQSPRDFPELILKGKDRGDTCRISNSNRY